MAKSRIAPKRDGEKEDGEDLGTILDSSQRANLTMLIANITESMRGLLLQNFDATAGLDKTLFLDRSNMTEDEKMMASNPSTADVDEFEKQRKLKREYQKDIDTLKMKNLMKKSLRAFDEWREQVVLRVGEVVNNRHTAKRQLENPDRDDSKAKPEAPATSIGKIVETPNRGSKLMFKDLYPPTRTPLTKLSMDQRTLILHSVLLLLLSLKHYNAPSRVLLLLLTSSLKLPLRTFEQDEYATAKGLLENAKELTAEKETKKKVEESKESRKWKVGMATAAGAAVIGVAGGLAAPLVAAGVASVMGGLGLGATSAATYLGSVAGSTYLIGGLFGAYGGRMTGQMMDNYAREVEDFGFLPVHSNEKTSEDETQGAKQASDHDHKLRITICISGWLTEKEEVVKPWAVLGTGAEVFALKYELEALLNLGNAMNGLVQSAAWGYAQQQLISQTIFAELASALWPIGLVKAARVIDNPFNVAKSRSEKAGEVLADALINKAQGERPVTLIGYSLGARVIYTCLLSLAKRKAFGLVENAVLFGAPTPSDTSDWRVMRTVVTGRLINIYSENDYVLGFMYRTSSLQYGVAGLQPVQGLPSVENVDVSDEVTGHLRYRFLIGSILKKIGFEDIDMEAVVAEREALKKMVAEEEKESLNSQRKRLLRRESSQGKPDEAAEADHEASEIEKTVRDKTQKSLVTRAIEYLYTPRLPSTKDAEKIAKNVQRAAENPSQVGQVASESVKDIQSSTQTLVHRAYQAFPSMPYLSDSTPGKKAPTRLEKPDDAIQEATSDMKKTSESYTAKAASYLPSIPQGLPSIPRSLPSMPGLGRSKPPQPKPDQAAKVGAKKLANTADELIRPTFKNVANLQDNPTIGAGKDAAKKMPIIHQAVRSSKNRGVDEKVEKATEAAGSGGIKAGNNIVDGTSNVGGKVGSKATNIISESAFTTDNAGKSVKNGTQSYTDYAASYLPSMPKWGGAKSAPRLDRKHSGVKSPPPKLERRGTSQRKLERKQSDNVKSSSPRLCPSRTNSGVKSSAVKLKRLPSGTKDNPTS